MSDERSTPSVADELEKLTELWNAGAITRKEFEEAKRQVLGLSGPGGASTLPGMPGQTDPLPPAAAGPAGLRETPLLHIPSGGVRLGNLHGRDDPPPIPAPELQPSITIELDPDRDADHVQEVQTLDIEPTAPPSESEPAPADPAVGRADVDPMASSGEKCVALIGAPEDESLELALQARGSAPGVDGKALPAPAVIGFPVPARKSSALRKYLPWILAAVVLGALALVLVLVLTEYGESQERLSSYLPGRGSIRLSRSSNPGARRTVRPVRWRPLDGFSCQAFQDRLDDCEPIWISRLEGEVRSKGIGVGNQRIAVGQPRVAVAQAQALVFESGGLHRCQVAQQRKTLIEQTWLQMTKACMKRRSCRGFAACHVSVFLRYVGFIPFHCRAYCNREVYHCGLFFARRSLSQEFGRDVPVAEEAYEMARPQFHRICLDLCAKKARKAAVRERMLECIFQPDCHLFSKCLETVPAEK